MSDVKHTALPWEVEYDFGDGTPVVVFQSRDICRVDKRDGEGNARYIVTACNAYPALVEALEQVEQNASHTLDCLSRHPMGECTCFRSVVLQALAQAQEDESDYE